MSTTDGYLPVTIVISDTSGASFVRGSISVDPYDDGTITVVLSARRPNRRTTRMLARNGGEGEGGAFLASPSHLSRALSTNGVLAVSLLLSALLVGLLTVTLAG